MQSLTPSGRGPSLLLRPAGCRHSNDGNGEHCSPEDILGYGSDAVAVVQRAYEQVSSICFCSR